MNEVIEQVKAKYPQYKDVPDDELTVSIAEKYPDYLSNASFSNDLKRIKGGDKFETKLNPDEEEQFSAWKQQYAPKDSGVDYDLRGAFKAGLKPGENGHWPDTFKKPNHPTFSNESIYAKEVPEKAGHWFGDAFTPAPTTQSVPLDPYQKADLASMQAGRGKSVTGMEPGTEFLTSLKDLYTKLSTSLIPEESEEMKTRRNLKQFALAEEVSPSDKGELFTPEAPPTRVEQIATGIERGVVMTGQGLVDFMTSPIGIATLGVGTLPKLGQRAVSLAFAATMAKETPEIARQLGDEFGKPEDQRDYGKISELITKGAVNTGFAATLGAKGMAPGAKPSPLEIKAEEIAPVAPLTAEALKQTAKEVPSAESIRANEGRIPETRIAEEVSPEKSSTDIQQPTQAGPEASNAQQRLEDIRRYNELDAKRRQMQEDGSFIKDDNFTPEFTAIWKELETIKNRYGGMPPETAHLAVPPEKLAEQALGSAITRTSKTVDDFVGEPAVIGISPKSSFVRKEILQDIPIAEKDLASNDPKVEARWKSARLEKVPLWDRIKNAAVQTKRAFTRHFPELDSKTDGQAIDILRRHEEVPNTSKYDAMQVLRGITAGLGPRKYDVFSRLVILPDLIRTIQEGKYAGKDLPFGYKDQSAVEADLAKFNELSERFPDIKAAVERRQEFIHTLRDELVARDLLPEQVKDYNDYFHRQVLEYFNAKESLGVGTGAQDVRTHQKGFQKARQGSSKDFNTNYLEAEFEVISQALAQIRTQDTLRELKASDDIKPRLMADAKQKGVEWETLVPEGYTVWQPKRGNHFYWANSLTEKTLDNYFNKLADIKPEDVSQVLAMGGPKEQWVIPDRLAKTLDNFGPPKENIVEKVAGAGISGWKVWTLLNPFRVVKYNLNNLSGDFDITMAYNPKILGESARAAKDLYQWNIKGKAPTPELNDAMRKGVVNAGFVAKEIPDINQTQFFSAISGKEPNIISKYWQSTKDFTQWRENVLRLSAYRWFKKQLELGKREYGASKVEEVDAIQNIDDKAAKLSRELIGDYGNISVAGQWIRRHMIPFYSWMEINAPRYVRMFKNLPHQEGGSAGRLAGAAGWTLGKKATGLAVKAAAFYGLVNLWNRTMFPDEEKELGDARRQLHLILGRTEDGSIRTMRIQGALSDALSWFGGEDLPSDIEDVTTGRTTVGTKVKEAALATPEKLIQASSPIFKTAIETVLGSSTYPDIQNPRPIRDRAEHVARTFSMDSIYRYLAGKPSRGGWEEISRLVSYTTDPGESAYYTTRGLIRDWLKKEGEEAPPSIVPNEKSNALYYYKQALRFGDEKAAEKYLNQYYELGGTDAGLKRSIELGAPLSTLKKGQRQDFLDSLSPEELEMIDRAEEWYDKTIKEQK